ncbi:MAG: SDR family oxidoreductase [Thiolinea sp.]
MIGITGATGQLGQLVIEKLLETVSPQEIVALVRNPAKAENLSNLGVQVREADYTKPQTLKTAFQGLTKLLLISSSEVGQRAVQHQAVIDAAKDVDLELFAYTSLLRADENPMMLAEEHRITEAAIKASGLPAAILRNGWYTENYTQGVGAVLQTGQVVGAADAGVLHTAARKDYADAAAAVLTSTENQVGKVYELAGDQGFTLAEYAQTIADLTGKAIQFSPLTETQFKDVLVEVGLPEGFAAVLADSEKQAAEGWLSEDSKSLSNLIGRPTTSLSDTLGQALNA